MGTRVGNIVGFEVGVRLVGITEGTEDGEAVCSVVGVLEGRSVGVKDG